ncbi:hypothetical protein BJD20_14830 [Acinetobacter proteolyticus]|uniref:hypothetical protein n=1 Tax=Acinetobacter proteolyticus TaxID=1776741 RepID=UPI0008633B94|nr:hypothetical protein [Acinetobacter proteolyticus]OEY95362.1 hypothetical protein BJD20_14830 [Acinetobacter proteolyticus]
MKKKFMHFLFILIFLFCYKNAWAKEHCHLHEEIALSIFKKNDATFISNNCEISPDNQYVESFLIIQNKKMNLNRVKGRVGNGEGTELVAVSLYRKKASCRY